MSAATALAGIGPVCLKPLGEVLETGNEKAQSAAVRCLTLLSLMGDKASFRELGRVADPHPDASIRACARLGLWDVMDPRASRLPFPMRRLSS